MKIKEFIKKLQNLPLSQRKIILWTIVIILGLILGVCWLKVTEERLKKIQKQDIENIIPYPSSNQLN